MADAMRQGPKLVTVFGGTGFVGRNVVRALAKRGHRIRVAVRRPHLAYFLQPMGAVGQIEAVQANLRFDASIERAVAGADAVVNLVGILQESGRQTFEAVQLEGPSAIASAASAHAALVHVSAIGADADSASQYARTKARAETAIRSARPDAVILRPSIVFGQGDSFFNRFASLSRALPVLPLAGAETRFQPVFVGDVAETVVRGVEGRLAPDGPYELGGPEIRTLRELVAFVLAATGRRRVLLPLPPLAARLQAAALEAVDALTLGVLLPDTLKLTRDQVSLLMHDNVVSPAAEAEGRTLEGLGIAATSIEAVVPAYLKRFRKTGQFEAERA